MPEIIHHVYLSTHLRPEDATLLPSVMSEAQIMVPECSGWSDKHLQVWGKVAKGSLVPAVAAKGLVMGNGENFVRHMMENIRGTNKIVTFFDIPAGHPLDTEGDKAVNAYKYAAWVVRESIGHTVAEKVNIFDNYRRIWGRFQERRENYMVEQPANKIPKILGVNPVLQKMDTVGVAWQLGSLHRRVAKKLENNGHVVITTSEPDPLIFPYSHQIQESDPNQDLDDELLLRGMLDGVFLTLCRDQLQKISGPSWEVFSIAKIIIGKIDPSDLPGILDRKTYNSQLAFDNALEGLFKETAQEAGITLPDKK